MDNHYALYRRLFLDDVPLMDVRAPIEFGKGAFPAARNLPLMTDIERQKVGTCYKQQGQQAAIELGHRLVSGAHKAERIAAWADHARAHPEGYLYCFRGGLRSRISQQWLKDEAGIDYPLVPGGYKALRHFLLETTEQALADCEFVVLGGMTGTGKTDVLVQLPHSIDLEGHAHHRGSSFGKHATGQPAQIDFENRIAIDLLKKRAAGTGRFVLEDEGRIIGSCSLPLALHRGMQQYPLVWLEDSLDNRVERILRDYVVNLCGEFVAQAGDPQTGFARFAERLRQSLAGIARRLGGERYRELAKVMEQALAEQQHNNTVDSHRQWIVALLNDYYDPMYRYQRKEKASRIVFAGGPAEVLAFLNR